MFRLWIEEWKMHNVVTFEPRKPAVKSADLQTAIIRALTHQGYGAATIKRLCTKARAAANFSDRANMGELG